ncbi:MAG: PIN domain-containing protein [Roseiarcus sp.]
MPFLIDTNIAIRARDGSEPVLDKLVEHSGAVLLSALSLAELQRGIYKSPEYSALRRARLNTLLEGLSVVPFDAAAAEAYGRIIAQIGWSRSRDMDRLIAAHALAIQCVLVTANVADYVRVPGLTIENWAAEV